MPCSNRWRALAAMSAAALACVAMTAARAQAINAEPPSRPAMAAPTMNQVDEAAPDSGWVGGAGAVSSVGPGDTLSVAVFGQPELNAQVTVDADGQISVPFLGVLQVGGLAPSRIGDMVAQGLREQGYLRDPQVGVEVVRVRSRVASILGEVNRPGRYAIEGRLTLLELLAMAGGARDGADDSALLIRQGAGPGVPQTRIEIFVGNRQLPSRELQDIALQAGDVVYLSRGPRFFVYGEVLRSGAYAVEPELNVMRAVSLAGGLTDRASERRIVINRPDIDGKMQKIKAALTDPVLPGDVVYVDERFF